MRKAKNVNPIEEQATGKILTHFWNSSPTVSVEKNKKNWHKKEPRAEALFYA